MNTDDESSKQNTPVIILTQYNVQQNFKPLIPNNSN